MIGLPPSEPGVNATDTAPPDGVDPVTAGLAGAVAGTGPWARTRCRGSSRQRWSPGPAAVLLPAAQPGQRAGDSRPGLATPGPTIGALTLRGVPGDRAPPVPTSGEHHRHRPHRHAVDTRHHRRRRGARAPRPWPRTGCRGCCRPRWSPGLGSDTLARRQPGDDAAGSRGPPWYARSPPSVLSHCAVYPVIGLPPSPPAVNTTDTAPPDAVVPVTAGCVRDRGRHGDGGPIEAVRAAANGVGRADSAAILLAPVSPVTSRRARGTSLATPDPTIGALTLRGVPGDRATPVPTSGEHHRHRPHRHRRRIRHHRRRRGDRGTTTVGPKPLNGLSPTALVALTRHS